MTSLDLASPEEYLRRFKTPKSVLSCESGDKQDELRSTQLQDIVEKDYNFSGTLLERELKESALITMCSVVNDWLAKVAAQEHESLEGLQEAGVHVFGSYRNGVNKADGDIDVVCLVPLFVRREDHFYNDLARLLKNHKDSSQLQLITGTLVPLLKVKIRQVQFDVLMANVPNEVLANSKLLKEQKVLYSLDEKSLRSINGKLVSQYIAREFSDRLGNLQATLKGVKLWAKNRQIYSQLMGFLGGIGVTIMVCKIVQLYPNYPPSKLLDRFFFIYSRWQWRQLPVLIEEVPHDRYINMEQWRSEKSEMMLITPAYPCNNAAFNITKSTMWTIREELRRADKIMAKVRVGKNALSELFRPLNVFKSFKNFMEVTVMANSEGDQLKWKGVVESRMKRLVKAIEENEKSDFLRVRPFPNSYKRQVENYKLGCSFYLGIGLLPELPKDETIEVIKEVKEFVEHVESLQPAYKLGECINLKVRIVPRHKLHPELFENEKLPEYVQLVGR